MATANLKDAIKERLSDLESHMNSTNDEIKQLDVIINGILTTIKMFEKKITKNEVKLQKNKEKYMDLFACLNELYNYCSAFIGKEPFDSFRKVCLEKNLFDKSRIAFDELSAQDKLELGEICITVDKLYGACINNQQVKAPNFVQKAWKFFQLSNSVPSKFQDYYTIGKIKNTITNTVRNNVFEVFTSHIAVFRLNESMSILLNKKHDRKQNLTMLEDEIKALQGKSSKDMLRMTM